MNHWQMIALAYSLTFIALALEIVLLLRRRRGAMRQARAWLRADPAPSGRAVSEAEPRVAASHGPAGTGAGS